MLSTDERRIARARFAGTRRAYVAAHALVRWALSQHAEVEPASWVFAKGERGKPEIARPDHPARLSFNLSHTDTMVACAVTLDRAIGVDVEDVRRVRRFLPLSERFFAPCEAAAIRHQPEEERARAFYRTWTLKEAYLKARGLGLSAPLSGFWFEPRDGRSPRIRFGASLEDDAATWQLWQADLGQHHVAALAVRRGATPDRTIELHEVSSLRSP